MNVERADEYIRLNRNFFPEDKLMILRQELINSDEFVLSILSATELKDPDSMQKTSIALGLLGIDRLMIGDIGFGIIKMFSLGGYGFFYALDIFKIKNRTRQKNFERVIKIIRQDSAKR